MQELMPYITGIVSVGTLLYVIAKDIFGGGNALANRFATLKQETTTSIADLRNEFVLATNRNIENSRVGFDAITANIHALQLSSMEFRANMAEQYMRRESFYKAAERIELSFDKKNAELKDDMKEGFQRVEKQLDEMAQAIEANRKANNHA